MNSLLSDIIELCYYLIRIFNPKVFIYITIYSDKLEMTDVLNSKTLIKVSPIPFSSNRLLIADNTSIETLGKEMVKELLNGKVKTNHLYFILHPIEKEFTKIHPVEKMILNDFAQSIGGHSVQIIENISTKLSESELKGIVKIN